MCTLKQDLYLKLINKSKIITEERKHNDTGDIFKSLFEDHEFQKERKEALNKEKNQRNLDSELKEATFHPNISLMKQAQNPSLIDPQKYLNLEKNKCYNEIYKQK